MCTVLAAGSHYVHSCRHCEHSLFSLPLSLARESEMGGGHRPARSERRDQNHAACMIPNRPERLYIPCYVCYMYSFALLILLMFESSANALLFT